MKYQPILTLVYFVTLRAVYINVEFDCCFVLFLINNTLFDASTTLAAYLLLKAAYHQVTVSTVHTAFTWNVTDFV